MPRQAGLYKVLGKTEGRVYYKNKRDPRYFWRNISPTMSENVKTLPQFETLRLNSYEFGGCSKFAGSIVTSLGDVTDCLLHSYLGAFVTTRVQEIMRTDSVNPIGNRQLLGTAWQDALLDRIELLQKLDPARFLSDIEFSFDITERTSRTISVTSEYTTQNGWGRNLASIGATDLRLSFEVFNAGIYPPSQTELGRYVVRGYHSGLRGSGVLQVGNSSGGELTIDVGTFENADNLLSGYLIKGVPLKEVNGTQYPMNRFAFFKFVPVSDFQE